MNSDNACAILEGGPADLPTELRVLRALPADHKIKVPHRGGYEHFEQTKEHSEGVSVFRWTMRTKIAE
jgi:Family of unknown function (DUF5988)